MTTCHDAQAPVRRQQEPPVWAFGDLIIRRYAAGDHEQVLALHRTALAEVGLRPGDGVYYEDDFPRLQQIYLDGGGEFVVAEPATATGPARPIVAMGGLRRVDAENAEMVRLRVRSEVRRRGYGGAIIRVLEERAVELGHRLLRCDSTALQEAALRLYRGFGWRETRRAEIRGIVTVHLEKDLMPHPPRPARRPPHG